MAYLQQDFGDYRVDVKDGVQTKTQELLTASSNRKTRADSTRLQPCRHKNPHEGYNVQFLFSLLLKVADVTLWTLNVFLQLQILVLKRSC